VAADGYLAPVDLPHNGLVFRVLVCCVFVVLLQAQMSQKHPQVMQLLQEYAAAKAAVATQQQQQPDPQVQGISRHDCALTLLGTGSSRPTSVRNVSAYYMDLFDKGGLLMDCGKGKHRQARSSVMSKRSRAQGNISKPTAHVAACPASAIVRCPGCVLPDNLRVAVGGLALFATPTYTTVHLRRVS
jgi:hypothetical protein